MSIISIPSTTVEGKVTFYQINIRLPLRSLSVQKRYSEFVDLVGALSYELGIPASEFPYPLPPKGSVFSNKNKLVVERQNRLGEFIASVIRDRDLQNRKCVHRFLQLPQNFKFTPALFKDDSNNDTRFLIDEDDNDIDKAQWLSHLRMVRFSLAELNKDKALSSRLESREKINKYIRPNVEKLAISLVHLSKSGEIEPLELLNRTTMLREVQAEIESVLESKGEVEHKVTNGIAPRRVFARAIEGPPAETNATIELNNKELLQQQQQVHKQQDQELEQLRMIIHRQKQIGETINREVEEQNELLERFSGEVDASSDKVKLARSRARKIG